jgi:hypothetical protein
MEDTHTALLKLDQGSGNGFFAVFDGHYGTPLIVGLKLKTVSMIFLIDIQAPLRRNSLHSTLQDASSANRHTGNWSTNMP